MRKPTLSGVKIMQYKPRGEIFFSRLTKKEHGIQGVVCRFYDSGDATRFLDCVPRFPSNWAVRVVSHRYIAHIPPSHIYVITEATDGEPDWSRIPWLVWYDQPPDEVKRRIK